MGQKGFVEEQSVVCLCDKNLFLCLCLIIPLERREKKEGENVFWFLRLSKWVDLLRRGMQVNCAICKKFSIIMLFKNIFKAQNNFIDYLVNSLIMKVKHMTQKHEIMTSPRSYNKLLLQLRLERRIVISSVSFH